MPHIGQPVVVLHLGARTPGIVQQIGDGGRRLEVLTEDGETLIFTLSRATGRFTSTGSGERLMFAEGHGADRHHDRPEGPPRFRGPC